MSEERRAAPIPHEVAEAGAGPLASTRPADDGSQPDDTGESRPARDSTAAVRRRGRMALRIPDDEVARPQSIPPEPPSTTRALQVDPSPPPTEVLPALIPTRIISITEPVAASLPPVRPPSVAAPLPEAQAAVRVTVAVEDDDDWRVTPPPAISVVTEEPHEPAPPPVAGVEPVDAAAVSTESIVDDAVVSVEPIVEDVATAPVLPQAPSTPTGVAVELDGDEVAFEDDALTPALPRVVTPDAELHDRLSDGGEAPEVSNEDVVAIEAMPSRRPLHDLPPMRPPLPSQPSAVPAPPKTLSKPPLVIVPPHVASVASVQPPVVDSLGPRRKGRFWWEELFNDDYLRTMEKLTAKQIAREATFIEESLGIERGGAVLDLACGTGRQAIELAHRGYEVVGLDLSLAMLSRAGEEAQSRSVKLNFVQGDMREMTFEEQFDGVYCWNTAFGYFEEEKNAHVVDRVRHSLKSGGLFLLDVVNRDFIIRQSPSLVWFEGDGCVCMDEMTVDVITSRMKVKRTLMLDDGRTREIEYSMRVYSLHELGKILHDHGFKVCEVSGRVATPGVFLGDESPRTIILAEKK
jgi:SAM-dependent methyltransferase